MTARFLSYIRKRAVIVSLFRPTLRRRPAAAVGADFVRTTGGKDSVGPCDDVVVDLRDLLVVEKFVPGLHPALRHAIAHLAKKNGECQLTLRINQCGSQRRADCILAMTPVAVNVPPLPAVIHTLINVRRRLGRLRALGTRTT